MLRKLVPLAGCALLLAGCGGGGGGGGSTTAAETQPAITASLVAPGLEPPAGCYVTVHLIEDITKQQIADLQQRLLRTKAVTEVAFVSKALEFRRFTLSNPGLARRMHVNPFTDRFEVVPRTNGAVFAIVGDFATNGGPITNVKPSIGCSETVG
jgi:hypothetical protein